MPRDGLRHAIGRVDEERMPGAFALKDATISPQMAEEFMPFHR